MASPAVVARLQTKRGARLFALGAYAGEVIRRAVGGTWSADDADPEAEINIELQLGEQASDS